VLDTKSAQHYRPGERESGSIIAADSRLAIAEQMEAFAIELRSMSDEQMQAVPSESTLLALAKKLYSARRNIDDIFGMIGFAVSPAWDIMLDLYQSRARGTEISISSACIGAACPSTTGLRWLQALEGMQLIERQQDPKDRRRTTVTLTEKGWLHTAQALKFHMKN
jgi:predicted transcriptional regulator